jgi:hypothetical protein
MKFLKHFQILAKIQLFMNFGDYMLNIRIFKSYRVVYVSKKNQIINAKGVYSKIYHLNLWKDLPRSRPNPTRLSIDFNNFNGCK